MRAKDLKSKSTDYVDPVEADYDSDYQAMVKRVGARAKQGPRKTIYDPAKQVYKTVPKEVDESEDSLSIPEGQEVDPSAVIGKLYDIIDQQEEAIKTADYDRQVRYATIVRDRAVVALNMIKTNPAAANSAWKYFQAGEQGEITEEMIAKRLKRDLDVFKNGQRRDRDLSDKPRDREIQKKAK
jgi:hypothetical protein